MNIAHVIFNATEHRARTNISPQNVKAFVNELEQAASHNFKTKQNNLFGNDFEFLLSSDSSLHEHKLRLEISMFINEEIVAKRMDVRDKHEIMNNYLNLIEVTPMFMFSKHQEVDRESGYFYEQNKILVPNPKML